MDHWENIIEATFKAISFDPTDRTLSFVLKKTTPSISLTFYATGVEEFSAQNLGLQNIVDRAIIYTGPNCKEQEFKSYLFFAMRGRFPEENEPDPPMMLERVRDILEGKLTLVVFEPVYCAELVVVARHVELKIEELT